jgi:hypothetical protein
MFIQQDLEKHYPTKRPLSPVSSLQAYPCAAQYATHMRYVSPHKKHRHCHTRQRYFKIFRSTRINITNFTLSNSNISNGIFSSLSSFLPTNENQKRLLTPYTSFAPLSSSELCRSGYGHRLREKGVERSY